MKMRLAMKRRRGATLVLSAFFMVVMLGMIAFAVDAGYIVLSRTQLQVAADASAMAAAGSMGGTQAEIRDAAKNFAGYHVSAGKQVSLSNSDVEFGNWDLTTRKFTGSSGVGNAIRITARRIDAPLFFGRVFGRDNFDITATATAMVNPRDICFVVDLSGSMNDDTEPCWATAAINSEFGGNLGNTLMTQIFSDFGFGTFPGTLQHVGQGLSGLAADRYAYVEMTKNSGPLTASSIAAAYKIVTSDNEATRKTKAYKWIIDKQIAVIMPNAKPTPNTTTNYAYWEDYIDYVIETYTVGSSGKGTAPTNRGALPPSQSTYDIEGLANPNTDGYSGASTPETLGFVNKIGYRTYVQYMLDMGRDLKPDGTNFTPLSVSSSLCPKHNESTPGGTFSFPPREQPTHAMRRAVIAAMKVIKDRNASIADPTLKDWVSVVTFDTTTGATIRQALTSNYDTAMGVCPNMQACADAYYSTATETGMITAKNHLKSTAQGGAGRSYANKVIVVLTDGAPNLYTSTNATINNYISAHPNPDYYSGSSYAKNAPLMQALDMQLQQWQVFPVGLGLGTDYTFMDKLGRIGGTADENGQSARGSGNPAEYEARLVEIFEEIIRSSKQRLVQ